MHISCRTGCSVRAYFASLSLIPLPVASGQPGNLHLERKAVVAPMDLSDFRPGTNGSGPIFIHFFPNETAPINLSSSCATTLEEELRKNGHKKKIVHVLKVHKGKKLF